MTYDGAGSIYALGLRVARLQSDGSFLAQANGAYVSDALVKIEFEPAWDTPDAVERRNGAGRMCVSYQAPQTLQRLTITSLEICSPDPELEELLGGGSVLTSASATRGYALPAIGADPVPNGVSVEAWSRAIINGAPASSFPLIRWVFPRVYLYRGAQSLESDAAAPSYSGWGIENANWGNGPFDDWGTFPSTRVLQWARMPSTDLPANTGGYTAIPTQT
jgi:hypothetical protein